MKPPNPDGLIPRVVRAIKTQYPELGVMCDVALDPYTTHGQDGLIDETGYILNDETIEMLLQRDTLAQARAGADVIAPSDMMDGRIGIIREAFEDEGLIHTRIMAYSAKYASSFYGPFRDAVGWSARSRRRVEQGRLSTRIQPMATKHYGRSASTSPRGLTWSWCKPGLPYLDVVRRVKDEFKMPDVCL